MIRPVAVVIQFLTQLQDVFIECQTDVLVVHQNSESIRTTISFFMNQLHYFYRNTLCLALGLPSQVVPSAFVPWHMEDLFQGKLDLAINDFRLELRSLVQDEVTLIPR